MLQNSLPCEGALQAVSEMPHIRCCVTPVIIFAVITQLFPATW